MFKAITSPVLFVVLFVACQDSEPRETVCEQVLSCPCGEPTYTSLDACVADIEMAVAEDKKLAADNGLVYDVKCHDTKLERVGALQCQVEVDDIAGYYCPACAQIHGDKPVGAACTVFAERFSDCAADLVCAPVDSEWVCVAPCQPRGVGERCDGAGHVVGCVDGHFCSLESLRCEPLLADGTACVIGVACTSRFCGPDGRCGPRPGAGQSCEFVCEVGLVCDAGTCVAPPSAGQPCVQGVCAEGWQCNAMDRCELSEAIVCEVDFFGDPERAP